MRRSTILSQRSCTWAALVLILCASIAGCNAIDYPSGATPVPNSPTGALPPLPPPTFTVSGFVRDGSAPGPLSGAGLNTGLVTIVDGAQAGTSVPIFSGGAYTIRDLPSGTLTLSAASTGYRTAEQTVVVEADARVDFALPRVSKSPIPPLAGVWTGLIRRDSGLGLAEFTFSQNAYSVTATWWSPHTGEEGRVSGTIDGERTFRGQITVENGCTATAALAGWIDYDERLLFLGATVSGCGAFPRQYSFEIRRCQAKSTPPVAC